MPKEKFAYLTTLGAVSGSVEKRKSKQGNGGQPTDAQNHPIQPITSKKPLLKRGIGGKLLDYQSIWGHVHHGETRARTEQ